MLKVANSVISASRITGTLPVANGGTGVTTSTGTGNTVLSASPTLSGDVTLSTGNLVVANGQGIDFSATPGTGTSELFADYEEGTWTPTLTASIGTITTVGTCTGQYTKIGRQVTLSMDLRITTNGIAAGFIAVAGIPINIGTTLYGAGCGTEIGVTGKMLQINPATVTTINITNYDGTYPGASGFRGCLVWTYFV